MTYSERSQGLLGTTSGGPNWAKNALSRRFSEGSHWFEPSTAHLGNPLVTAGFFVHKEPGGAIARGAWQQNGNVRACRGGCRERSPPAARGRRRRRHRRPGHQAKPQTRTEARTPRPRPTDRAPRSPARARGTRVARSASRLPVHGRARVEDRREARPPHWRETGRRLGRRLADTGVIESAGSYRPEYANDGGDGTHRVRLWRLAVRVAGTVRPRLYDPATC